MLMLSSWSKVMNNSEWSEGSMNGESCDLSLSSPALAGYLGNTENRGMVSAACPWCSAKGQINDLRSYAVNLKESITLCTSPLCLFPLVSGPLDNIRAIISSPQDIIKCKRKFDLSSESRGPDPSPKHWKKEDLDIVSDVKCQNVDVGDCSVSILKRELFNDHKKQQEIENADTSTEIFYATSGESGFSEVKDPVSSSRGKTSVELPLGLTVQHLIQVAPTQQHLFWKNKENLCWLDSLLVALVYSRVLRETSCENECLADKSPCTIYTVKNLCAAYKTSYAYIKAKEQQCQDNIVRVPSDDLRKVEKELEALRLSAFQFLKPMLQCELGSDDWANGLFQHTGQWEFRCTCCGYNFNTSIEKTVTTFTQIMADWHPLRAVHRTKCSNCHNKNQKRKLVLQSISSVLALHFVEGLPRRDISKYAFNFHGRHYNIRTIIQYNEEREHFVTWIHQPDGLWLEFDDLKYPHCITHKRFTIPARQFHLIFWEASSTESFSSDPVSTPSQRKSQVVDVFQDITKSVPDESCINENKDTNKDSSSWDASIGSTTLLDTFEGLSHSDIVTLTLVEVKDDHKNLLPDFQEKVMASDESSDLREKGSFCQTPCSIEKKKATTKTVLPTPETIFPSVEKASESKDYPKTRTSPPAFHSKPSASNLSLLFHQHPSHQSTPSRVPFHSEVDTRSNGSESLLAKPAELFGGYRTRNTSNSVLPGGHLRHSFMKFPTVPPKLPYCPGGITSGLKSASQNIPNSSKLVSSTEALRLKLMKRLKAKKKKLAELNQLLSIEEGESTPRPDSTDVCSPYSVTSSTSGYDSPAFDDFFAELISPTINSSNLSPDSTVLLEILSNSQIAGTSESNSHGKSAPAFALPVPLLNYPSSTSDCFLDEPVIDNSELNALDIFF
ncbi:SUMO-specific isopeptidase USPL1 isoform X2 [Silurus meridionalis]|uniref:SUMO-specific isopeptidase USPL1 isoform X2 n=1 Tax=Silurus meridionalis TaxID=175797 RepID=UPI001EEB6CF8|nr:SUMO-specific isopeptidase USPL1 isoform X2 [Silurus meridionalis]